jgi:uncharacterized protein (UPF0179 family)
MRSQLAFDLAEGGHGMECRFCGCEPDSPCTTEPTEGSCPFYNSCLKGADGRRLPIERVRELPMSERERFYFSQDPSRHVIFGK